MKLHMNIARNQFQSFRKFAIEIVCLKKIINITFTYYFLRSASILGRKSGKEQTKRDSSTSFIRFSVLINYSFIPFISLSLKK